VSPALLRVELPEGVRELAVEGPDAAAPLSELLARRGLPLNTRCGGRGLCAGCEIELRAGRLERISDGSAAAPDAEGVRRACQVRLPAGGGADIAVPARSLLRHAPAVVAEFQVRIPWARDPLEPGARYGAAVDAGTTTVALLLCDLAAGRVLAEESAFNAQIAQGEDVLTRIQRCATDQAAVGRLQRAMAAETIQPLLAAAAARAGVALADVGVMTVAANTTMQHLLAGVDPSPLGVHPFTPGVSRASYPYRRGELGLVFGGPGAVVHLLPGPAAYVGADLAAGVAATGLLYREGLHLLVDVGTNGEIIAQEVGRLLGCATAAGPGLRGRRADQRGTRGVTRGHRTHPAGGLAVRGDISASSAGTCLRSVSADPPTSISLGRPAARASSAKTGASPPQLAASAGDALVADAYGRKLRLHPQGALRADLDLGAGHRAAAAGQGRDRRGHLHAAGASGADRRRGPHGVPRGRFRTPPVLGSRHRLRAAARVLAVAN
jgi:ferredoxin